MYAGGTLKESPQPRLLGLDPSFGFGDRIGVATPGHAEAMRRAGSGISPIFPQQSIHELTRTGRSAEQVMSNALAGVQAAGWAGVFGADADHLKTTADVDATMAAGFTFFTIDPSDQVDEKADSYDEPTLRARFDEVRDEIDWEDFHRGRKVTLDTGTTFEINEEAMMRTAVKYGRALNRGIELSAYINKVHAQAGKPYEIELSVDETEQPTTLAEHYIIADQCLSRGMKLVSLAPRFIGEMEKGVDYIGDVEALEASLRDHNAISEQLGPYKLSLHSGSDKISMYSAFARATDGRFHVKTAGTSYLEALRVAAHVEPELFRRICEFARGRYEADKATYPVHATLEGVPAPSQVADPKQLEQLYLECWNDVPQGKGFTQAGRQILHCTFGSVLRDAELGTALKECLSVNPQIYCEILAVHFARHLDALMEGM